MINSKTPALGKIGSIPWNEDNSGNYSVKSFIDTTNPLIFDRYSNHNMTQFIWQRKALPKAQLVAWFLS